MRPRRPRRCWRAWRCRCRRCGACALSGLIIFDSGFTKISFVCLYVWSGPPNACTKITSQHRRCGQVHFTNRIIKASPSTLCPISPIPEAAVHFHNYLLNIAPGFGDPGWAAAFEEGACQPAAEARGLMPASARMRRVCMTLPLPLPACLCLSIHPSTCNSAT